MCKRNMFEMSLERSRFHCLQITSKALLGFVALLLHYLFIDIHKSLTLLVSPPLILFLFLFYSFLFAPTFMPYSQDRYGLLEKKKKTKKNVFTLLHIRSKERT